MAAAIGAGLPVAEATGSMVVDIGGGTSEVAVISLGGIVSARSRAGRRRQVRRVHHRTTSRRSTNLLIGERTAEEIKIKIGSAYPYEDEAAPCTIKGRNLADGLPKNIDIYPEEIREALADPLASVVDAIKSTLEKTPPELSADIIDHGIILTGGGALLRGLDKLVERETGMLGSTWQKTRWTAWHWAPVWCWKTWTSSGKCWTTTTALCKSWSVLHQN